MGNWPLSIFATIGGCTYLGGPLSGMAATSTDLLLQKTEKVPSDSAVGIGNHLSFSTGFVSTSALGNRVDVLTRQKNILTLYKGLYNSEVWFLYN